MADQEALAALIAEREQAILATINRDGRPQLSNMLYVWDPERQLVLMSTTASRLKTKNLKRDPRCSIHVSGDNFWVYAVAHGEAELSAVAKQPGDAAIAELLPIHSALMAPPDDEDAFARKMIDEERLAIRFRYSRLNGVIVDR
jgi:PPOX class probable F420-dependent enzyme